MHKEINKKIRMKLKYKKYSKASLWEMTKEIKKIIDNNFQLNI